ncbi:MAG TPA: CPBP family intramembrane glutamic endopeptidase, partial [Terracidiphilus sp.]
VYLFSPLIVIAAVLALAPYLAAGFFSARFAGCAQRLPVWVQIVSPSLLCVPYLLVTLSRGNFSWAWLGLYAVLPVLIAVVLLRARGTNSGWPEFLMLAILGLAVDLRWFEPAWPAHLAVFGKVLLLDAGIYGFIAVRDLEGVGFDLRLRSRDFTTGLREVVFYLPLALALGLGLGFLHLHPFGSMGPVALQFAGAWIFTFFLIAVPEELFFRGWLQNLLERCMGRWPALITTAVLFGLSHFNKRALHFNWRYVLMAAIAGIFYGRAWRRDRRVGASAVTHATVDAVWSLWLR